MIEQPLHHHESMHLEGWGWYVGPTETVLDRKGENRVIALVYPTSEHQCCLQATIDSLQIQQKTPFPFCYALKCKGGR